MCGIAGYVATKPNRVAPSALETMTRMIRHRGPDGIGRYTDAYAGLGHARLSIIDLAGGQQPMTNEDRSLWITFNGEIFNYIELARDLEAKGHVLATKSDTEVILHLYEEHGEDCVRYMNGQWAFGIWDSRRREMFLSRDRIGIRPLYYTQTGTAFLFGSEIKALFAHPGVSREFDPLALDDIFVTWSPIPPRTAFRGVYELPPGQSMRVREGQVTVFPHWELNYSIPADAGKRSAAEYAEELFALLQDATRIRLRSDVPVGAYLSGGLDSAITAALARGCSGTKLHTFSVAFEDREYDEREFQQQVAEHLGVDHETVYCSDFDIGGALPEVVWYAEKPVIRTAPAPLLLLSRLVRESSLKVVLTGEGADEMFGGYDIFKEAKIRRFCLKQPHSRLRPALFRRLYPYMANIQAQPVAYLREFFQLDSTAPELLASHMPRWQLGARNRVFFSEAVKAALQTRDIYSEIRGRLPSDMPSWDAFCQAQYLEARYLLPGYILSSQGDRVAMANGVEGRYPFLDYRVMEFAAKLPPHLKMRALNEKYLLKRTFGKLIPPAILQRPKQPYRAPEARCLFTSSIREYVEYLLSPEILRKGNLFHPPAVERLAEKVRSNQAIGVKDNMALIGITSAQMVVDQFIDRFSTESTPYTADVAAVY